MISRSVRIMIYKIDFNFSILLINSLILTSFLLRCIPATWKLKLWVYSWKKKLSQDLQMVTLSKKMVLGNPATEISELVVGCEWVSSWDYSTITGSEHVNSPTKGKTSSSLWIIKNCKVFLKLQRTIGRAVQNTTHSLRRE